MWRRWYRSSVQAKTARSTKPNWKANIGSTGNYTNPQNETTIPSSCSQAGSSKAAVLKMSTCFMGPFTLGDLAASTASRWGEDRGCGVWEGGLEESEEYQSQWPEKRIKDKNHCKKCSRRTLKELTKPSQEALQASLLSASFRLAESYCEVVGLYALWLLAPFPGGDLVGTYRHQVLLSPRGK